MTQPLPTALDQILIKLCAASGTPLPSRPFLNVIVNGYGTFVDNPNFVANGQVVGSSDLTLNSPGYTPPTGTEGALQMYDAGAWTTLPAATAGQTVVAQGLLTKPLYAALSGHFGDGSDGAATCDGATAVAGMSRSGSTYTQTRDCYFTSLTISAGVTVKPAGYRTFVSGTTNIASTGAYTVAGGAGTTSVAGSAGGAGTSTTARLGGSSAGANGGISGLINSFGGSGGNNSFGDTATANTPPTVDFGTPHDLISCINGCLYSAQNQTVAIQGGGGGAGSASCFGGGGGGVAVLVTFLLTGAGAITANGGAGCTSTQKGGGGGGGVLFVITRSQVGWTGTITATGGAAGGAGATAGGSGLVVQLAV
jgi:hypothetical protein